MRRMPGRLSGGHRPRTCGTRQRRTPMASGMRFILPARAGNTPCACGEFNFIYIHARPLRVREQTETPAADEIVTADGSSPARAGTDRRASYRTCPRRFHPRPACGNRLQLLGAMPAAGPLSLRACGEQPAQAKKAPASGSITARAGTYAANVEHPAQRFIPRARLVRHVYLSRYGRPCAWGSRSFPALPGGNRPPACFFKVFGVTCFMPRACGNSFWQADALSKHAFIPARAGNRNPHKEPPDLITLHPARREQAQRLFERICHAVSPARCGEQLVKTPMLASDAGSPAVRGTVTMDKLPTRIVHPRMRNRLPIADQMMRIRRFIPPAWRNSRLAALVAFGAARSSRACGKRAR